MASREWFVMGTEPALELLEREELLAALLEDEAVLLLDETAVLELLWREELLTALLEDETALLLDETTETPTRFFNPVMSCGSTKAGGLLLRL